MRCRAARRLLVAYQDGELSPGEATQVSEHLAGCVSCREREGRLRLVTPKPMRPLRPPMDPDWSRMDRALAEAWSEPAPRVLPQPPRRLMFAVYGMALGLVFAWGVANALRVQGLEAELAAVNASPSVDALIPATTLRPASYKPPESDGKPH